MNHPIRVTLSVTTLLLAACGGAPFVALEGAPIAFEDGGSTFDAGTHADANGVVGAEAGALDAARDTGQDAHELADALSDSAPAIDAADAAPACTTRPPLSTSCGTAPAITYPANVCLLVNGTYAGQPTPSACASWCTFTCACLVNVCPSTAPFPYCTQHADGTILVECGTS